MNKETILITGASKGIGFEISKRLLIEDNRFSNLILVSRKSNHFNEATSELEKLNLFNKKIYVYDIDLSDREELKKKLIDIKNSFNNIDVVINNAGYTNPVNIHQLDIKDFDRTMQINLYAPFIIIQELLKLGNVFNTIVNIASTAGIKGRSGWLSYSSSKAALINMSEVMKEELSIYGTRVICISPGRTATDLRKKLAPNEDQKTIMQPEDLAEVVFTLISPVGRFIDSENLVVRI